MINNQLVTKILGMVVIIFTILISIVSVLIMLNFNSASSYAHEVLTVRRVTLVTVREMIDTMHDDLFMSQEELENNTPELLKGIEEKVNAVSAKVNAFLFITILPINYLRVVN